MDSSVKTVLRARYRRKSVLPLPCRRAQIVPE
jgi:hypothetical protein